MDFGSFLNDVGRNVGNFFGFNQKKKRPEDQPQPTVTVQRPSSPVFGPQAQQNSPVMPSSLTVPLAGQPQHPAPMLGGVDTQPNSDLSPDDRATIDHIQKNGGDPTRFIQAARNAKKAEDKASYDNSIFGKIGNFGQEVVKQVVEAPVKLGEGLGAAEASVSPEVQNFNATVDRNRVNEMHAYQSISQKLRDPNIPQETKQRLFAYQQKFLSGPASGEADQAALNRDLMAQTDPLNTVINAVGTAALPLVGGVTGAGARTAFGTVAKTIADPLSLLEHIPKDSIIGRLLNTEIASTGRNKVATAIENGVAKEGGDPLRTDIPPTETPPPEVPTVTRPRDPNAPITETPTPAAPKPGAITSPNRPAAATVQTPKPFQITTDAGAPPVVQGVRVPAVSEVASAVPAENPTAVVAKAIEDQASQPKPQPAEVAAVPAETPITAEAKQVAPPVNPAAVEQAIASEAAGKAPTDAIANEVPNYNSPHRTGKAGVPGNSKVNYSTGDPNLDAIVNDSIIAHKGTANTAGTRADALDRVGIAEAKRAQIRNIATKNVDKVTGRISPEGQQAIRDVLTGPKNVPAEVTTPSVTVPSEAAVASDASAPVGKLGTITHQAVVDGSINTPEGAAKAIADTRIAATQEAEAAGDTLPNIIKKGQAIWEKSKAEKHDLTTEEVLAHNPKFTKEQQQVYKDYAQEITTLRDRSGLSLDGGHQGPWYAPRQSLTATGESAPFDPSLVNEISRNKDQASGGVTADMLDTSHVPHEQAMQRYANAPEAAARRVVETVETNLDTGVSRGIKVPDTAKQKLETSMVDVVDKRDTVAQLLRDGDTKGAKELQTELEGDINSAFNDFIDEIPGSGKTRRQAINDVKAMRGTYLQTTMQSLALSNVFSRVADQATKAVYKTEQPLVTQLNKVFSSFMAKRAEKVGGEVNKLNTSKEAIQASKDFARGTLWHEIKDNFKANVSMAGAGRNPVVKAIAKIDSLVNSAGTAATQAGDLSTQVMQKVFQLGASRPEAAGLKTAEDFNKYLADYVKTDKFKQDLDAVNKEILPRIGLAGGNDAAHGGGVVSKFLSKNVDNVISTQVKKAGIKPNRLINELNGYFKSNITGFAGVGSRVLGNIIKQARPFHNIKEAVKVAQSGDPAAVARATQMASQSVADAIAVYGTAGAAILAAKTGGDVIGFTGPQAKQGSSDSAYNKANNIPANQWYINLPGGNRVYFDPARPFGAPGVAADLAGGIASGNNPVDTAKTTAGQLYNQTGGSSLPETASDLLTIATDTSASDAKIKSASGRLQQTAAPSTGILNNFANWQDPSKRAPTNFVEDLQSNLPVLRANTPASKDSQGNTIANSKQISGGSGLFSVAGNPNATKPGQAKADPVAAETTRLQKVSGDVFPTVANTNASNKNVKSLAKTLLSDPVYISADDKGKASMLKDVLAGTAVKDINTSIPPVSQQALLDAKLLGKEKTKAWLDNNDNAASYYSAVYDNAKANKTLTAADEDLQNKSGKKYVAIRAKVDQTVGADESLRSLYDRTTQSEFKAMRDPESDNYDLETAQKLFNYDEARTKSGVSGNSNDTSKSKYTLKAKGSGSGYGSRGGRAAKNFAFASLPASLIGTGGTGSGGNGGYANNAPLFRPIADLQAPATVAIPKGRSISVKRGIQV